MFPEARSLPYLEAMQHWRKE